MKRALLIPLVLLLAACGGGQSAAVRAKAQAVQACQAAAGGGASRALALVHAHQAAGLNAAYAPLATAMGQVGVLQQSFGADLGAGEDDTTGATALATVSQQCATLGVTVSATAQQNAGPLGNLTP